MAKWTGNLDRTVRKSRRPNVRTAIQRRTYDVRRAVENSLDHVYLVGISKGAEVRLTNIRNMARGMSLRDAGRLTGCNKDCVRKHWLRFCDDASWQPGRHGLPFDNVHWTIMGPLNRCRLVLDVYERPWATTAERVEMLRLRWGVTAVSERTVRHALETVTAMSTNVTYQSPLTVSTVVGGHHPKEGGLLCGLQGDRRHSTVDHALQGH